MNSFSPDHARNFCIWTTGAVSKMQTAEKGVNDHLREREAAASSGADEALKLTPHSVLSLEQCLEFIAPDELVEVTPKSIRMRKTILDKEQRMKHSSRKLQRDA